MRLGTKARYAVMAMVDLAKHGAEGPVALAEISDRQDISLSYLEQIFGKLRRGGLVTAARGPGGGYALAHDAEDIRVSDIISAVEEELKATRCHPGSPEGCMASKARCLTHDLWEEMGRQIHLFLSSVSVADVANRRVLGEAHLFPPGAAEGLEPFGVGEHP